MYSCKNNERERKREVVQNEREQFLKRNSFLKIDDRIWMICRVTVNSDVSYGLFELFCP